MSKSVAEQLEQVEAALDAVETGGQRYRIKERELWRANHAELEARRDKLEKKARREKRGGIRVARIVPL